MVDSQFSCVALLGLADAQAVAALEAQCFATPWTVEQYGAALTLCDEAISKSTQLNGAITQNAVLSSLQLPIWGIKQQTTGMLVAYVSIMLHHAAGELEVYNIAVNPQYRGIGLGKQLLLFALPIVIANGITRGVLEVRKGNAAAIGLYSHFGFTPCGERKNYYSQPVEDAVVMCSEFTENSVQHWTHKETI